MTESSIPTHLFVVSDCAGYVGTFDSLLAAKSTVLEQHPTIPFIIQRFPICQPKDDRITHVWVVLYRDLDAVAFVSNDRDEAIKMQSVYNSVSLSYTDSIDYWEQSINTVAKGAADRLMSQTRAHTMYAGGSSEADNALRRMEEDDQARLDALTRPLADGPLARVIRENEKITIFDAVVPVVENIAASQSQSSPS